jgi:hypothetical protein
MQGPGAGGGTDWVSASGAGHAGLGGFGNVFLPQGFFYGSTIQPITLGSGGGIIFFLSSTSFLLHHLRGIFFCSFCIFLTEFLRTNE